MFLAMALDSDRNEEEGVLIVGLEAVDIALLLADDGTGEGFHIPLADVGAPVLKGWSVQLLGPLALALFERERRGSGNGDVS